MMDSEMTVAEQIALLQGAVERLTTQRDELVSSYLKCERERDELLAFHDAWVETQVASATGNIELIKSKRDKLLALHKTIHTAIAKAEGGQDGLPCDYCYGTKTHSMTCSRPRDAKADTLP